MTSVLQSIPLSVSVFISPRTLAVGFLALGIAVATPYGVLMAMLWAVERRRRRQNESVLRAMQTVLALDREAALEDDTIAAGHRRAEGE